MNKSGKAAMQTSGTTRTLRARRKKIALKVHTPEYPTDKLIEKYRNCGRVSDAIQEWL